MVKPLFDTNILIDYLNGLEPAREELRRYDDRFISIVSWMEVLAGTDSSVEEETRKFLNSFETLPIDEPVAELAVVIRQKQRVRLPDAIIQATASVHSLLLVTR
ncbi:type II toxin-antitoxin system VapC family toxin, partial [Salmonella enterica subsp. enterica serovar Java]|nr:type II toxin-antitoxin system VapC family toxin [Salmonella enterica subsp. enterica serovar Java]